MAIGKSKKLRVGGVVASSSNDNSASLDRILQDLHTKLDGAVFNGGFEGLVASVENLEKTQREMLARMNETNQVIYEPDDGLFARVKRVESIHREEFEPLRRDLRELIDWKDNMLSKEGALATLSEQQSDVKSLMAWRRRILALALSALGATGLMLAKTFYDLLVHHVSLH